MKRQWAYDQAGVTPPSSFDYVSMQSFTLWDVSFVEAFRDALLVKLGRFWCREGNTSNYRLLTADSSANEVKADRDRKIKRRHALAKRRLKYIQQHPLSADVRRDLDEDARETALFLDQKRKQDRARRNRMKLHTA